MTEREKIVKIIADNRDCFPCLQNCRKCKYKSKKDSRLLCMIYKLADALIEAGIGDVKETELCVAIAVRASVITAERVLEYAEKAKVTAMTSDGIFSCDKNVQLALLVNDAFLKAKKELVEVEE